MDEPTIGLDPHQIQGIRKLIDQLRGALNRITIQSHFTQKLSVAVIKLSSARLDWLKVQAKNCGEGSARRLLAIASATKDLTLPSTLFWSSKLLGSKLYRSTKLSIRECSVS